MKCTEKLAGCYTKTIFKMFRKIIFEIKRTGETFIFYYEEGDEPELIRVILEYAKDDSIGIHYADVVIFVQRLRSTMEEEKCQKYLE